MRIRGMQGRHQFYLFIFISYRGFNTNKSSRAGWRNLAILISQTMENEHKEKTQTSQNRGLE